MTQTHLRDNQEETELDIRNTWNPLRLFNLYRLTLSTLFLIVGLADFTYKPIGELYPTLFLITSIAYLGSCVATSVAISKRKPSFHSLVYFVVIIDIIAITLIMHSSGGVKSGVGMLMVGAVAGGSVLLAGQTALQFAAIATLTMLSQHVYFNLTHPLSASAYTHAGLLGAAFFATAILAHALAKRVRASEALALQRGVDLANMEQTAQYIMQHMQTGIIVTDASARVWVANESARELLNIPPIEHKQTLQQACPQLADQYELWANDRSHTPSQFRATTAIAEVLPRFAALDKDAGTIIFLEDTTAMAHHAQQLKLASLGRLAGSIAHEIRNPLGAISHAGQLLAESPNMDRTDIRLTEIISTNSARMNRIIENVLQLGRRQQSLPETIQLNTWLTTFIDEFCVSQNIPHSNIDIKIECEDLPAQFDPNQLHQVLWNLCQNGAHHSLNHTNEARLQIIAGISANAHAPHIDVIDYGPGIAAETLNHIFEPFFTTEAKGTGLGLYIARELSECNNARLSYLAADTGGSCFRVTFADPRRRRAA